MLDVEVDLMGDLGALGGLGTLRAEESSDGNEQEPKRKTTEYHFGVEEGGEGTLGDGMGIVIPSYVSDL
jgi:hypothetical protein